MKKSLKKIGNFQTLGVGGTPNVSLSYAPQMLYQNEIWKPQKTDSSSELSENKLADGKDFTYIKRSDYHRKAFHWMVERCSQINFEVAEDGVI